MKKIYSLFAIIITSLSINAQSVLQFGGTNAYVTFGVAPQLCSSEFSLECWFNKQAAGVTTTTGTGGVTAVPLIAKGRGEADGDTRDANYFLGINAANQLCADFEEITPGTNPGLNHPITGITAINNGTWYHACATYDGNQWKLYLNGALENTVVIGALPQNASIQHASIGSALNSTGVASGFFNGMISEARMWDTALSSYEILANINIPLTYPLPHLVSRWGLDEGSGTVINSVGNSVTTGTIIGSNWQWITASVPFNINLLPTTPALVNPANTDSCQGTSVGLAITTSDLDNDTLIVKFYGRVRIPSPPPFTIVGLPDTQHYCAEINGGTAPRYYAQTNWIVANHTSFNIPFVAHFGDCVQNGDNSGNDIEWKRCDTAMKIIENPITTTLVDGIPYAMNVGNHDQSPVGSATGTTTFYSQYFGISRFSSRPWYGNHYGSDYDNFYDLFSASGMDFVIISLEYDATSNASVLTWADSVLQAFSNRRGIVVSHYILNADSTFGTQGAAIYNALKGNANLDLMLCGHVPGESHRTDIYNGNTVHSILADYQSRSGGGDGWLRLMEFNPATNKINVKSYSPYLNQYETDASSQFSLNYNMTGTANPFVLIGIDTITTGDTASVPWSSLMADSTYEWYAVVYDSLGSTTGTINTFSTFGPTVSFSFSGTNSFCQNSGTISLPAGSPVGGTYSGTGVSGNNFNTNNTAGIYPVNYFYSDAGSGCSTSVSDNIILKPTTSSTSVTTNCNSYILNSVTYTTSGAYTQSLVNSVGCDSLLTINLTINNSSTATLTQSSCDNFTLNGTTYSTSGTYTQNGSNWHGCDSVTTINLTINQSPSVSYTQFPSAFCLENSPYILAAGTPSGGFYSGVGIVDSLTGLFDPQNIAGFYSHCYTYIDGNGCSDSVCSTIYTTFCIGIQNINEDEIILFPNPTTGILTIEISKNEIESFRILNLFGQEIEKKIISTSNSTSVDLTKESKGIYFAEIKTTIGIYRKKIVLQ